MLCTLYVETYIIFVNSFSSYDAQSFAIPVATLEFATLCLRNALLLLSGTGVDYSPSNPISPTRAVNLKAAVLVASAYVSLCLGDPIVAMNNCKNVLSIPNCSNVHKYVCCRMILTVGVAPFKSRSMISGY